jgi:hypothetical protein
MEDFRDSLRHDVNIPRTKRVSSKEAGTMSDEDRKATEDADEEVRAHVKQHGARRIDDGGNSGEDEARRIDDGGEDEEVRAHVKQHGATDDGDDEVRAHVKQT